MIRINIDHLWDGAWHKAISCLYQYDCTVKRHPNSAGVYVDGGWCVDFNNDEEAVLCKLTYPELFYK